MKARRIVMVLAFASFLAGRPALSAELGGPHMRVVTSGGARFQGRLASAEDGSFTLVDEGGIGLSLDPGQVGRLEMRQRRSRGAGALRGGLIGAGAAALLGVAVYLSDRAEQRVDGLCGTLETGVRTCTTKAEIPGVVVGGAMIGAVWGALRPGVTWKPLRAEDLRLVVAPMAGGGMAARATLRF